jgi:hypothetical protein
MNERQAIALPSVILGLGIMAVGMVLVLGTLSVVQARELLRFWPAMLIVLGAAMVSQAIWGRGGRAAESTPGAGYAWFAWLIIVVAVFSYVDQRRGPSADGSRWINVHSILSRQQQTVTTSFQNGTMTSVMGRSLLDLRHAPLEPGEDAVVDVFALMGGLDVHVPPDWVLDVQIVSILGGVDDERRLPEPRQQNAEDDQRPRLLIRGIILMGGMNVVR